jgi:hypothetical protein
MTSELGYECCSYSSPVSDRLQVTVSLLQWASKAGLLLSQARFEDVYGLDDEVCLITDIWISR